MSSLHARVNPSLSALATNTAGTASLSCSIEGHGNHAPPLPTKRGTAALGQANSVYDLSSTEQAIRWMHAVCGYPVKSTWLKAIKAGNYYIGWPLLTVRNVQKYYPKTEETPKRHITQTRKNVRSTKQ